MQFTFARSLIKEDAQILPEVAFVWINSDVCYDMILRYEIGTTGITYIYENDISNIIFPILSEVIQTQISNLVRQSQTAQSESKRLLALAKQAVEVAIEQSEAAAEQLISSAHKSGGCTTHFNSHQTGK